MNLHRNNRFKHLGKVLLTSLVLMLSAAVSHAATVESVSGYVTVTSPDGEVKRLKSGDALEDGHVINTGNNSGIEIKLPSGESITLGSLASYTVGKEASTSSGGSFAQRSLGGKSPTLSTATSAGGGFSSTNQPSPTPGSGGSPTN